MDFLGHSENIVHCEAPELSTTSPRNVLKVADGQHFQVTGGGREEGKLYCILLYRHSAQPVSKQLREASGENMVISL